VAARLAAAAAAAAEGVGNVSIAQRRRPYIAQLHQTLGQRRNSAF